MEQKEVHIVRREAEILEARYYDFWQAPNSMFVNMPFCANFCAKDDYPR